MRIHELGAGARHPQPEEPSAGAEPHKGIHAAAMALLAESASGFLVGMNVPDDKLPLIKTMKIDYLKRAQGDLTAIATLEAGQIEQIRQQDRARSAWRCWSATRTATSRSPAKWSGPGSVRNPGSLPQPPGSAPPERLHLRCDANRRKPCPAPSHPSRRTAGAAPGGAAAGLPWCGKKKPPCARPGEYSRFNAITDWARVITNKG